MGPTSSAPTADGAARPEVSPQVPYLQPGQVRARALNRRPPSAHVRQLGGRRRVPLAVTGDCRTRRRTGYGSGRSSPNAVRDAVQVSGDGCFLTRHKTLTVGEVYLARYGMNIS